MSSIFDETLTLGPRVPRRREMVCIFPDDVSPRAMSPRKRATAEKPVYTMNKAPPAQTKRQQKPMLPASAPKAPLQQNMRPPQPRASTRDIPGRGGGKENVPPGMSVYASNKDKTTSIPRYRMSRGAQQNITPTQVISRKPRQPRKESSDPAAMNKARNGSPITPKQSQNAVAIKPQAPKASLQIQQILESSDAAVMAIEVVRAYLMLVRNTEHKRQLTQRPKCSNPIVTPIALSSSALLPGDCSSSERDQSAIIIQRVWRSYLERRKEEEQRAAINKAKVERAVEVITRWWRGLKPNRQPEQAPRRKAVARRSTARKSSGRLGIRRL